MVPVIGRIFLGLAASLSLIACSKMGPDFTPPRVETPAQFHETTPWQVAEPAPITLQKEWWLELRDPELNRLEIELTANNNTIKMAEAQYRSARALLDNASMALFPTLSLTLSDTRAASSSSNSATGRSTVTTSTSYGLMASSSWEVDVWGRVRRGLESAEAKSQAGSEDLAATRISAQLLLAQVYLQVRNLDRRLALLTEQEQGANRFLQLTKNRLGAGVASSLDVAQAETQLQSIVTQLRETELQRAQAEHGMATLLGRASVTLQPLHKSTPLVPIPATPALIPSWLLQHRPDIAAAERRVADANAQIGVTKAAFFPAISLGASGGFKGSLLEELFQVPNRFWSLGPSMVASILDSGQRNLAYEQALAAHAQAEASYRQTVLTAFQEVEDNLAALRLLEREAAANEIVMRAAQKSREIAEDQYRVGTTSSLTVVTARNAELSARITSLDVHHRRLLAALQLLKNCGGRWEGRETGGTKPEG
ncbi:MAG: efflux transporter outer membrane subunit [Magnetococcales bacterium]|nr:efflux transporter outer membrane subunit [Magnetococcales bacterium]